MRKTRFDERRNYLAFTRDGEMIRVQDGNYFAPDGRVLAPKEVPKWVQEQVEAMGGLPSLQDTRPVRTYACPVCDFETASRGELLDHLREAHEADVPRPAGKPPEPVPVEEDPDLVSEYDSVGDAEAETADAIRAMVEERVAALRAAKKKA